MDLYGHGWYDDPVLWDVQRRLWPSENALLARPRPYTPDVAAIVGENSQLFFSAESRAVTRPLIYTVRGEFDKAGDARLFRIVWFFKESSRNSCCGF